MTFITDPIFYLVAIPAILMFGMSKGGFGGGISALAIPLMALAVDPVIAAAIMLPILLAMDAVAIWKFRHSWDKKQIQIMLPAAVVGIAIASMLMGRLSTDTLKALIGFIAISFCLQQWFFSHLNNQNPGRLSGYFWGMLSGFTSTQIHAGGVTASIYLLPKRMDKMQLMGTLSVFFTAVNLIKLIPYSLLGQFDKTNLSTSLILMPLAPVGVLLGYFLLKRFKGDLIYRVLYLFLFVAGVKLVWDGLI